MDECLQPRERPHPRAEGLPELVIAAAGSRAGFCCAVHAIASSAAAHGCLRATETRRRASVLSWRRAVERGARRHRSEPSKDGASASASASDEGQALGLPLRPLCHHDPSPGAAAAAGQAVPKGISNLKHEYKLNTTANDDKVSVALIWSRCSILSRGEPGVPAQKREATLALGLALCSMPTPVVRLQTRSHAGRSALPCGTRPTHARHAG